MKIIIAAGGTGGHIYPAIAVAEELLEADISSKILFVGSEDGIERDIVERERFSFRGIKSKKILRKFSFDLLLLPFIVFSGMRMAGRILKEFKPDMIISTGGYASFPVVLAGAFHRIPILLHEQNTIPGIVNRICQFFAKKVAISYQTTSRYFLRSKVAFTGNPVRKKILKAVASVGRQKLNLDQKRKTLLILGGSQGARRLNEIAAEMVDFFIAEDIQVIHITGRRDYDMVLSKTGNRVLDIEEAISEVKGKKRRIALRKYKLYHTFPYMYNIWDALSACDIALSRAGATAIAEIEARGIPSIIVPFPYSAEGHQQANAKVLLDAGAAVVFKEEELTAESLSLTIRSFFADRKKMNEMSSAAKKLAVLDAAKKIALIAYDILTTRGVLIKSDEKRVRTKKRKSVQ